MNQLWMVCYDIEDNNTRRRVHGVLKNHGEHVQYSVFECWVNTQQVHSLRQQLRDEIEPHDSIRWYPLCVWCRKNIDWQGQGAASDDPPFILL